jgi:nitronate monooxygenase
MAVVDIHGSHPRPPSLDQWRGREAELAATPEAQLAYQAAVARGEAPPLPVWASEGIDLVTDLPSADLVTALAAQADTALARAGRD